MKFSWRVEIRKASLYFHDRNLQHVSFKKKPVAIKYQWMYNFNDLLFAIPSLQLLHFRISRPVLSRKHIAKTCNVRYRTLFYCRNLLRLWHGYVIMFKLLWVVIIYHIIELCDAAQYKCVHTTISAKLMLLYWMAFNFFGDSVNRRWCLDLDW